MDLTEVFKNCKKQSYKTHLAALGVARWLAESAHDDEVVSSNPETSIFVKENLSYEVLEQALVRK